MIDVTISISDEAFSIAQSRAKRKGFASTEAFFSDLIVTNVEPENYDHLFTPEVIADLDRIFAEINNGAKYTRRPTSMSTLPESGGNGFRGKGIDGKLL